MIPCMEVSKASSMEGQKEVFEFILFLFSLWIHGLIFSSHPLIFLPFSDRLKKGLVVATVIILEPRVP